MAKLLAVDDESQMRLLVRLILEREGHEVIEAESGEVALEVLANDDIDAVVLDLRMPGIGGWGVLETLRDDGRLSRLPVLVVSAHASEAAVERAKELGCAGYLRKPFTNADLRIAVGEVLGGQRSA